MTTTATSSSLKFQALSCWRCILQHSVYRVPANHHHFTTLSCFHHSLLAGWDKRHPASKHLFQLYPTILLGKPWKRRRESPVKQKIKVADW